MITHVIGNLHKETETYKNEQMEVLEMKSKVMEGKNPLDEINSGYKMAEEKKSENFKTDQ